MPRYLFNILENSLSKEKIREQLPNALAARRRAQEMARELGRRPANALHAPSLVIDVTDESRQQICVVLVRRQDRATAA
ncbi:MAG TPA: hypothetical protein VFB45_25310 [Pseudolabrys sp.]|nr:hypothetical protein [Pseudolabrys sp.]